MLWFKRSSTTGIANTPTKIMANEASNMAVGWLSNSSPLRYLARNPNPPKNKRMLMTYLLISLKNLSMCSN